MCADALKMVKTFPFYITITPNRTARTLVTSKKRYLSKAAEFSNFLFFGNETPQRGHFTEGMIKGVEFGGPGGKNQPHSASL